MVQTGLQTIGVGPCCALWTICELGFCFVFVFCKQLQLCRGVLCGPFVSWDFVLCLFVFCVLQTVAVVPWCALSNVCKDFVLFSQGKDDFVLWVDRQWL